MGAPRRADRRCKSRQPRAFRAAFSDARFALELIVSAGDLVAARWRCTATHAKTGAKVADYVGVNFFRVSDGKIVEIWDTRDDLGLFAQLGLVPPPPELPGSGLRPTRLQRRTPHASFANTSPGGRLARQSSR